MAIGATTVWRVRTGGNNANGGGYDSGIAGAGTDYSQQDAAQTSGTTGAAAQNSTTFTDAGGAFTAAMIGNALQIASGTNFIAGIYFITAFASATSITLDRAPATAGAGSAGVYKVGGGWADPFVNTTAAKAFLQPGNQVFIRGSGSSKPSSDDYTKAGGGSTTPAVGDATNGMIKFIGENGRPRFSSDGNLFVSLAFIWFENVWLASTGTNSAVFGMVSVSSGGGNGSTCYFINVVFDQHGNDIAAFATNPGVSCIGCEFFSSTGGSGGSSFVADLVSDGVLLFASNVHDAVGSGVRIQPNLGTLLLENVIAKNNGSGITVKNFTGNGDPPASGIINNTIDANTGDGINLVGAGSIEMVAILNNLITNHTGGGKFGVNANFGSTAVNDRTKGFLDWNFYFGNTTNFQNISAGADDTIGTNPGYAAQSTEGYNIGATLASKAYPQAPFLQHSAGMTATQTYIDPGGAQRK